MRIEKITNSHRNDFYWHGICEHCSTVDQKMPPGYDDANYHRRVIPAMHCKSCGLNRAGEERRPVEAPKPGQTFALMYVDADENGMNGRTIKVPLPTPQEPTNG